LLEGEENRVGLRQVVDSMYNTMTTARGNPYDEHGDLRGPRDVMKGEMSAKTTYQKSAKGPVSIPECGSDGKYVSIENTGRKEESLGQWTIKRIVDGQDKVSCLLDDDLTIKAGGRIKIWAKGQKPSSASENDIECEETSFGVGADITTKLVNPAGEDRASHVQKTTYI